MTISFVGRLESWTDTVTDDGAPIIAIVLRQDAADGDDAWHDRVYMGLEFGPDPAAQHQRQLIMAALTVGELYEASARWFATPDRDAGLWLVGQERIAPRSLSAPHEPPHPHPQTA